MSTFAFPSSTKMDWVGEIQSQFEANGVVGLLKELLPISPIPTLEELEAAEADYTGYARKTIASLPNPYYDAVRGGVSFQVPTQQFQVTEPGSPGDLESNQIYGMFFLDASNNILAIATWNPGTPMQVPGDACPLDQIYNFFGPDEDSLSVQVNGINV